MVVGKGVDFCEKMNFDDFDNNRVFGKVLLIYTNYMDNYIKLRRTKYLDSLVITIAIKVKCVSVTCDLKPDNSCE